jgi:hypothetical protein
LWGSVWLVLCANSTLIAIIDIIKKLSMAFSHYFLATDPEDRVRFSALPEKKVVRLERGPLSLVSKTEELLGRKVAAPV